jgi:integrase
VSVSERSRRWRLEPPKAGLVDENGRAKFSLHALRHAFASALNEAGVPIDDAVRHSKSTMTVHYTHSLEDKSRAAIDGIRIA